MAIDVHHRAGLTAAELGNLTLVYMANTMFAMMFTYMANRTDDPDIRTVISKALTLSEQNAQQTKNILTQENVPIPVGFGPQDVVPEAPKLWSDVFHLNFLSMMAGIGPIFYAVALPTVARLDIQKFFMDVLASAVNLHNDVDTVMLEKGLYVRPPYVPIPTSVEFVHDQKYLRKTRPLNALEIAQIHANLQFNATKVGLLTGFRQVTKMKDVRAYYERGIQYNRKQSAMLSNVLSENDVSFTSTAGQDVTTSTIAPFSEKLMLYHSAQLSSAKARNYGDAIAVCARHDLGILFMRLMTETGLFAEDGVNLLIDHEWLEQLPQTANRDQLANARRP